MLARPPGAATGATAVAPGGPAVLAGLLARGVPGTLALDYLSAARLAFAREGATVATCGRSRRLTCRRVAGARRFTTLECVAGTMRAQAARRS